MADYCASDIYCSDLIPQEALKEAEVLYEEHVLYFDETRKWRERYVVVRANYSLECHESYEVTATRNIHLQKCISAQVTEFLYVAYNS